MNPTQEDNCKIPNCECEGDAIVNPTQEVMKVKTLIKLEISRLCEKWHTNFKDRGKYNNNYDEYLGVELSKFLEELP